MGFAEGSLRFEAEETFPLTSWLGPDPQKRTVVLEEQDLDVQVQTCDLENC